MCNLAVGKSLKVGPIHSKIKVSEIARSLVSGIGVRSQISTAFLFLLQLFFRSR